MTAEIDALRPKTGLEQAVGDLGAPGIQAKLEALEHMDPLSVAILSRRVISMPIPNDIADELHVRHGFRVLMCTNY